MTDERDDLHEAQTRTGSKPTEGGPHAPAFPVENWDKYRFLGYIGEGGMGRVYKALDPKLNRVVALKFIRGDDPVAQERFFREARAQARIQHDHVCKVYETGEVEGRLYIAMQYIDGFTLSQMRNTFTLEQKVKLIKEASEGIQAAHRLGLIHRDIKPGNIMVEKTEDGWHPYVLDFGLARETQAQGLTVTGAVVGTPGYMAPEQAWGDATLMDRRMDVYSLGATLYFLLGGVSPFEGDSTMIILRRMLQEEPKPLARMVANIPLDLETIVMKCLEKEPARRYDSARALADDLQRWLDGEPIEARRASLAYRLGRKARKNKALVAVSGLALLAIILLAAYGIRTTLMARQRAALAQRLGQQVERMDAILRVGHTIPLHDTRPEKELVRSQMREIEVQMKEVGSVGEGPGNYALGRGAMALDDYDSAARYLQRAWDSGYRDPEVAYALGLSLGHIYQRELELAENIRNKDVREARRKEIEKLYRIPAVEYLHLSAGASTAAPEYVEGLIALYEARYDDALKKAKEALTHLPWLYEARLLEGNIHSALGNKMRIEGNNQGAFDQYRQARDAYEAAARIGESDGDAYEALCNLSLNIMYTRIYSTGGDYSADVRDAEESCGKALQTDPDRASAHTRLSNAYWIYANSQSLAGVDSRPSLDKAIQHADRAIELNPNDAIAYKNLGTAYQMLGGYQRSKEIDPTAVLQKSITAYAKAMSINPSDITVYNSLGNTYAIRGDYEKDNGRDPRKYYQDSIDTFLKGIAINPKFAFIYSNLGVTYKDLSLYEESHGFDPEPNMKAAIENYKKCLDLKSDDVFAWNNLANGYKNLAEYYARTGRDPGPWIEQGLQALERPQKINPDYSTQYSNLGELLVMKGEAAARNSGDPRPDFERARQAVEKELTLKKSDPGSLMDLANLYVAQAKYAFTKGLPPDSIKPALETLDRILATDSFVKSQALQRKAQVRKLQAQILLKQMKPSAAAFREAESAMQQALDANTGNAYVWKDAAALSLTIAEGMKQPSASLFEDGLNRAEKALGINPKLAEALAIRARLYKGLAEIRNDAENSALAKKSYAEALALNPRISADYPL